MRARCSAVVLVFGLVLVPALQALACPFCSQGAGRYGQGFSWLVLMMLVLPFALVGFVLRQILKVESSTPLANEGGVR